MSGDWVFPEYRFTAPSGGRHAPHDDEHNRTDRHEWNRPQTPQYQRGLALVNVGVLASHGRGLAQIGGESRPALDLEAPLVKGVQEDWKVERQDPDSDHGDTNDSDVERAMVIMVQIFSRSGHADVGDELFTYRHLIPQQPSHCVENGHYVNGDSC